MDFATEERDGANGRRERVTLESEKKCIVAGGRSEKCGESLRYCAKDKVTAGEAGPGTKRCTRCERKAECFSYR